MNKKEEDSDTISFTTKLGIKKESSHEKDNNRRNEISPAFI